MTFSFSKSGFWKLFFTGLALQLTYITLRTRYAELSPHYYGVRSWSAKLLLILLYIAVLTSLMAAAGTAHTLLRQQRFWKAALVVAAWIMFFSLFAWTMKHS
jgi:hypothetical protein